MPSISKSKKDKISEQILHYLFSISPESRFTSQISAEMARDEEFTKSLLLDLEKKGLIARIDKNKEGIDYSKRQRWRISSKAFSAYSSAQPKQNNQSALKDNNLYNVKDFQ